MEVYRPLVDQCVLGLTLDQENNELLPDHKMKLAKLLQADVWSDGQLSTVGKSMQLLAFSLVNSYKEKAVSLQLPDFKWGSVQLDLEIGRVGEEDRDVDDWI